MPGRPLTEMEWRVGRAIYEATPRGRRWEDASEAIRLRCLQRAHDAISAMREPTVAMLRAGEQTDDGAQGDNTMTSEACWAAMIDAALEDRR